MRFIFSFLLALAVFFGADSSSEAQTIRYENFESDQVKRADSLLSVARTRLSEALQDSLSFPATIFLARTREEFDLLVGGQFPDWGAAAALPRQNLIVIKSPKHFPLRRSLDELLVHEYAHLALGAACAPGSPPRWMDEGLATWLASPWEWEQDMLMSRTAVFGTFPSLEEIDEVNGFGEERAELSYATSRLAFEFFLQRFGPEGIAGYCWGVREGQEHREAFQYATRMTVAEFEREFHAHLRERYDLLTLLFDMRYFWLLLVGLLIVGGVMRILSRRSYHRRWKEQEKLESTDFEYGDPKRPEQIEDDEPWRGEKDRD